MKNVPMVQWVRVGVPDKDGTQYTKWHIEVDVLDNERGRTGCGVRYPLGSSETTIMDLDQMQHDPTMCQRCLTAYRSKPDRPMGPEAIPAASDVDVPVQFKKTGEWL